MNGALTEAVMAYKNSGQDWQNLYERICIFAYEFPVKWSNWDEDRRGDFFLFFMPKIRGIVSRYRPVYSFETYLSCTIRWNMKTFAEKKAVHDRYVSWTVEESERQTEIILTDNPGLSGEFHSLIDDEPLESDCPFDLDEQGRLSDPAFRRRLLFVVLLRAADIPEDRIPVLAGLTGVDTFWLEQRTRSARDLVRAKAEKREKLKRRRNECWYHLNGALLRAASDDLPGPDARSAWERRARTWRKRYATACESLRRLSVTPSHEEVGRLLEVPPGTVSSGLFFVRKIWKAIESGDTIPRKLHPKPGTRRPAGPKTNTGPLEGRRPAG